MRRYHYVDLLRGFAAIAVVIFHYRGFYPPGAVLPLEGALWPIYTYGNVAVPVFWMLSGFVFAEAYGRFGKDLSPREFALHRFARLYPLHFLTLVLMAALQSSAPGNDPPHFVLHLFMASNWFTTEMTFNRPIWSVSVEVLVYFAFLLYMKRTGLSLWVALTVAAAASAAELMIVSSWLLQCIALFFAGVGLAIVTPGLHARFAWGLAAVAVVGIEITIAGSAMLLHLGQHWVWQTLSYAGAPSLLLLFVALDLNAKPLNARWHWIGLSTYSIYLLHIPIRTVLSMTVGIVPLPVFLTVVIGLSVLCYRYIEAPAQRWIRGWRPRTAPVAV